MAFKQSRPGGHGVRLPHLVKSALQHPLFLAIVTVLMAIALLIGVIPTPTSEGVEGRQPSEQRQTSPSPEAEGEDGGQGDDERQAARPAPQPGTNPGSEEAASTIEVSGTFDGGMRRFHAGPALGDGGQAEGQKPIFRLAPGAVLSNVVLAAPAADGVHCENGCTLLNVHWEDVGEDAATFRGTGPHIVRGCSARNAADKVFQFNGSGTLSISGCEAHDFGKLVRSNGSDTSMKRNIEVSDTTVSGVGEAVVRINSGDTTTLRDITVQGAEGESKVCVADGVSEGGGPDGTACRYSESDITYR